MVSTKHIMLYIGLHFFGGYIELLRGNYSVSALGNIVLIFYASEVDTNYRSSLLLYYSHPLRIEPRDPLLLVLIRINVDYYTISCSSIVSSCSFVIDLACLLHIMNIRYCIHILMHMAPPIMKKR